MLQGELHASQLQQTLQSQLTFTRNSSVESSSQTMSPFGCIWMADTVHKWFTPSSMHLASAMLKWDSKCTKLGKCSRKWPTHFFFYHSNMKPQIPFVSACNDNTDFSSIHHSSGTQCLLIGRSEINVVQVDVCITYATPTVKASFGTLLISPSKNRAFAMIVS